MRIVFFCILYSVICSCINADVVQNGCRTFVNPYASVDWADVYQVPSCSHEHALDQAAIDVLINEGLIHIALSNYYPSQPYYPLTDFFTVPQFILSSPNAEHHSMSPYATFHCNAIGSFFSSGSVYGKEPVGMNDESWEKSFDKMLQKLQFEDGGGIIINHPKWSRWSFDSIHPSVDDICKMLDYDNRVLGIEIYNSTCEYAFEEKLGWDIETWDSILKTGRRCWGFSSADHRCSDNKERMSGLNILLCSCLTEHDCLRAYRDGRFYCSINNTPLRFNSIVIDGDTLSVSTSDADFLYFVINGVYNRIDGNKGVVKLDKSVEYVRIEAHNNNDSIFSNPILIKGTNGVI